MYRLLTDDEAAAWVDSTFWREEDAPVRATYHAMNDPVLRADFLRYLLIYAEGGVYTDLDTTALRPISTWIPPEVDAAAVSLVVGVEVDEPHASALEVWRWKWASRFQLCQWTFMGRAGHPALARMVERVVRSMSELAERERTSVAELRMLSRQEVLATTGPLAWTRVLESYMSDVTGTRVDWHNMTGLRRPKLIGDVLVLPVTALGPGQRHSGSGPRSDPQALSMHHFGESQWAKAAGRGTTWRSWFGF